MTNLSSHKAYEPLPSKTNSTLMCKTRATSKSPIRSVIGRSWAYMLVDLVQRNQLLAQAMNFGRVPAVLHIMYWNISSLILVDLSMTYKYIHNTLLGTS